MKASQLVNLRRRSPLFLLFFTLSICHDKSTHPFAGPLDCSYVHVTCSVEGQCLLVDLRSPDAYEALHIPGSINESLFALTAKSYLRTRHVILVHENNWNKPSLDRLQRLKLVGFNRVSWLQGGLKAWAAAGLPLAGDLSIIGQWSSLDAAVVFATNGTANGFLLIQLQEDRAIPALSEVMLSIPTADVQHLGTHVRELVQQSASATVMIFMDRDGNWRQQFEQFVRQDGMTSVYFLTGGQASLEAYLKGSQPTLASSKTQDRKVSTHSRTDTKKTCDCQK